MTMPWPIVRLGEVAEVKSGYPFKSESWVEAGIPVIKIANVKNGNLEMDGCSFVAEEVAEEAQEFRTKPGDILIAMTGYVGDVALVRSNEHMLVNQRVGKFIIKNPEVLDLGFFFSFLRSPATRRELEGRGYGSAQPNISPSLIHGIEMPLPPIGDQRRIAHILGSLDDKIDLNRRMNETLEATARAIFQSWFVDFDPVRAKAEGRQPFGMDSETAALFSESFDESAVGQIPKWWKHGKLEENFNLTMGQSPPGDTYNEGGDGTIFFQGCTDFGFRFPIVRMFCNAPTRFANEGDTLVSVRAPVGDLNMARDRCCIGRGLAAVRHKSGSRSYSYYFMQSKKSSFDHFEGEGTIFGSINKKDFLNMVCISPPSEIIKKFEELVFPLDEQIRNLSQQSSTLATVRDTLLPRLLSGQLSLSRT